MTSLHRHPPRLGSTASSLNASAMGAGMVREGFRARSIVRGGGRLFQMSPVEGYTEAEMNQLARERVRYNRKRAALKQMCHTFENSRRAGLVGQIDKALWYTESIGCFLQESARQPGIAMYALSS